MKNLWVSPQIKYDGSQLSSLWAFKKFGLQGDSIIAFSGPCAIPSKNIVDCEDLLAGCSIRGDSMLHFIIEHFEMDLEKTIIRQRLFATLIKEIIESNRPHRRTGIEKNLTRRGDDLFDDNAKLTISIATLTPVSTKIHFGINITSKGTPRFNRGRPFKTTSLQNYGINPKTLALEAMERYIQEMDDITMARAKVRGIC
ncbi:MAG: DUF366 family protein [Planctomycetota bacterium]